MRIVRRYRAIVHAGELAGRLDSRIDRVVRTGFQPDALGNVVDDAGAEHVGAQ